MSSRTPQPLGFKRRIHLPIWMAIVACLVFQPVNAEPPLSDTGKYELLPDTQYAVRLAVDLLGAHPTVGDLEAIAGGTLTTNELIERYLDDERFYHRLLWIANDFFLTERTDIPFFQETFDDEMEEELAASVGEEPLRLFQYLVSHDLPMTELATAPYTVADSTLAKFWGIDYPGPEGGSEWMKCHYMDGRPHSGVLSMQSFYFRYDSTAANKQRGRANHITRIFLDDNHFQRNVSLEFRLANNRESDIDNAVRYNPGCLACHASLEGIVGHLQAVQLGPVGESTQEFDDFNVYSHQGIERWQLISERVPSYYGRPSDGKLTTLGKYLANDPRFSYTMAKRMLAAMVQGLVDHRERELIVELDQIFRDSEFRLKDLIRAIVKTDLYRAIGVTEEASEDEARLVQPFRVITPEQMATLGYDLTGQTWGSKTRPSLEYDPSYKIPAGGYDGIIIDKRSHAITPMLLLTYQRHAEAIADDVYDFELRGDPPSSEKTVFTLASGKEDPVQYQTLVKTQISQMCKRFYGQMVGPSSVEVGELYDLLLDFKNDDNGSVTRAWRDLLSLMLRDPRIYFY
ncbi:MAG: DUF1592 domain-containing protein [Candidatus Omnitrophica bacterium]|nr:DUF1592 domain-containing protein [Candidatus Omnitrophota bacterium]